MKIAISTMGSELSSEVDARFGRAKAFMIYDTDTDEFEMMDNVQNLNAPQGAGIQSASNVINRGVGAVITGHIGPNAFRTLSAAEIEIYIEAAGTVQEMLEKYKAGELKSASGADRQGHWM
ncbi:MAG TPA: NifB/NifX family molybdenum-iron cluster-binding protein [bacterium]|nr:NifB/NifX family molybdenum-iron cluster-binding protein [bacterium]